MITEFLNKKLKEKAVEEVLRRDKIKKNKKKKILYEHSFNKSIKKEDMFVL